MVNHPSNDSNKDREQKSMNRSKVPTLRLFFLLLLLALLMRLGHGICTWEGNPSTQKLIADALYYENWSGQIISGSADKEAPFYLPPLYPYFLTLVRLLFGASLPVMLFIQGLLGLLNLWMIHHLARTHFGPRAAFFAVLPALFYAPLLFFETKLVGTTFAIFLGLLSVIVLSRGIRKKSPAILAAAGLLMGLLCETRPNFLIFAGLGLILIVWITALPFRKGWTKASAYAAGLALPLAFSLGYNAATSGEWILITGNGGINFYFGNHENASGVNDAPTREFSSIFDQGPAARRLAEQDLNRSLSQSEVSSYWMRKGLAEIAENPAQWLGLLVKKARLFLSSFGYGVIYLPEVEKHLSWVLRIQILPAGLILALGFCGLWIAFRQRVAGLTVLLIFLFSNVATVLIFFMAERFRTPFMAGLMPFAGLCLAQAWQAMRHNRWKALLIGAAGVACFTALSFLWVDDSIRISQYTRGRLSLAKAFMEAGRYPEARKETGAVLELLRTPSAVYHLGLISEHEGDKEEAMILYREAGRLDPTYLEPLGNLAAIHEASQDWDRAIETRKRVIDIVPDRFEGYYNLGLTCIDAGRIEQGIENLEKASSLAPQSALVWEALGRAYERADKPEKALEAFNKAIMIDPTLADERAETLKMLESSNRSQ